MNIPKQERVNRAKERGQHTEPGTKPNAMDHKKVARKKEAKRAHDS